MARSDVARSGTAAVPAAGASATVRWLPLIVLGGALGTGARAALEQSFPPAPAGVPWTTLAINVAGSFLLGLLLASLSAAGPDRGPRRGVRLTLGTGVLGGFTTYSTFIVETADRLREGHTVLAVAYLLGSVLVGLIAAGAGITTATRVHRARHERARR
jgi:CrcB protein